MEELNIEKKYARVQKVGKPFQDKPYTNSIRVYESMPGFMAFQIRSNNPLTQWGAGKNHNMLGHVELSIHDAKDIVTQLQAFIDGQPK